MTQNTAKPLGVGVLEVDTARRRVHVRGGEVHLTPTEWDLLVLLVGRPGTVFRA